MSTHTQPEQGDAALYHHCRFLRTVALEYEGGPHPREVPCLPEDGGCGARGGEPCRLEPRPEELSDTCVLEVTPRHDVACQVRREVWQAQVDNLEWWGRKNGAKPHSSITEALGPIGIECPEHHVPTDTPCPGPSAPVPDSEAPVERNPVARLIRDVEALAAQLNALPAARELIKAMRAIDEARGKAEAALALMTAQARAWARELPPPATVAERYSEHELVRAPVRDALQERDEQHGLARQVLVRRADDWTARCFLAMAAAQQERDIRTAAEQALEAARAKLAAYQELFGSVDIFQTPLATATVCVATVVGGWTPVDGDIYKRRARRWSNDKRAGEVWKLPGLRSGWGWEAFSPWDGAVLGSDVIRKGPGPQDTAEQAQALVDAALEAFCQRRE